ncbi:MAG TPA: UvrY/SirA/GacA family response regulator transcription factor [Pseudomonadales bacterium]
MIKVVVVDDHDLVRTGILRLLDDANGIKVVGDARNGEDAIKLCRELSPDIALMDVRMPGIGGLEATRKITHFCPDTRVIALTVCVDDPFPSKLLEGGASGFLTKDAGIQEMIQAIRTVASGQRYLSAEVAQSLALKTFSPESGNPFEGLSDRELQICLMVVSCQKVTDIAEKLHLSPKTVNSYRYRIFEKLSIASDVELTHMAMRHGLLDGPLG